MQNTKRIERILSVVCAASFFLFAVFVVIASLNVRPQRLYYFSLRVGSGRRFLRYAPFLRTVAALFSVPAVSFAVSLLIDCNSSLKTWFHKFSVRTYGALMSVLTLSVFTYFFAMSWANLASTRKFTMMLTVGPLAVIAFAVFILTLAYCSKNIYLNELMVKYSSSSYPTAPPVAFSAVYCFSASAVLIFTLFINGGRLVSHFAALFGAIGLAAYALELVLIHRRYRGAVKNEKKKIYMMDYNKDEKAP